MRTVVRRVGCVRDRAARRRIDRGEASSCAVYGLPRHKIGAVVRDVHKSTGFIDVDVVGVHAGCYGGTNRGEISAAIRSECLHVAGTIIHDIGELGASASGWWIVRR